MLIIQASMSMMTMMMIIDMQKNNFLYNIIVVIMGFNLLYTYAYHNNIGYILCMY